MAAMYILSVSYLSLMYLPKRTPEGFIMLKVLMPGLLNSLLLYILLL